MSQNEEFTDWVDDNFDELEAKYLDGPGAHRGLTDDDLPDLGNDGDFQEWCEEQFIKAGGKYEQIWIN